MGDYDILKALDPTTEYTLTVDNCYGVHPPDFKDRYVFDIGANIGLFSHIAAGHGAKWVFSVEPNANTRSTLSRFSHKRMSVLPCGVSSINGIGQFKSNCDPLAAHFSSDGDQAVPLISLDSLLGLVDGDDLVVKIDVEGLEYDILYGASRQALDRISVLCLEIHDSEHQVLSEYVSHVEKHPLHTEQAIKMFLKKQGFTSCWSLNFFESKFEGGQENVKSGPITTQKFVHI